MIIQRPARWNRFVYIEAPFGTLLPADFDKAGGLTFSTCVLPAAPAGRLCMAWRRALFHRAQLL